VKVVRNTSDLIDGQLWCLTCCRKPYGNQPKRRKLRQQRRQLFDAHPFCVYCNCELQWESSTVDHVVPLSKGGTHDLENLVLACELCNSRKGSKLLVEGLEPGVRFSDHWARAQLAMQMRAQRSADFREESDTLVPQHFSNATS